MIGALNGCGKNWRGTQKKLFIYLALCTTRSISICSAIERQSKCECLASIKWSTNSTQKDDHVLVAGGIYAGSGWLRHWGVKDWWRSDVARCNKSTAMLSAHVQCLSILHSGNMTYVTLGRSICKMCACICTFTKRIASVRKGETFGLIAMGVARRLLWNVRRRQIRIFEWNFGFGDGRIYAFAGSNVRQPTVYIYSNMRNEWHLCVVSKFNGEWNTSRSRLRDVHRMYLFNLNLFNNVFDDIFFTM